MNPFAQILGQSRIPVWRGPSRSHVLMGETRGAYGKRWVPWTLIVPGVTLPTRAVVAGLWKLL